MITRRFCRRAAFLAIVCALVAGDNPVATVVFGLVAVYALRCAVGLAPVADEDVFEDIS